jgi:hypothetical protein
MSTVTKYMLRFLWTMIAIGFGYFWAWSALGGKF